MKFDHIAHDNQSTSTKKVSCFIWKKKGMKLTGLVTFIYINKYSKTEILVLCYWHN